MADVMNVTNITLDAVTTTAEDIHLAFKSTLENSGQPLLASITQHPFIFFIINVITAFVIAYAVVLFSKTIIKWITSKTETDLDDILLEKLQHPVAISIFLLLLSVAFIPLSLSSRLADVCNKLLISGNIFLIGTIVNRIVSTLVMHFGTKITAKTESTIDDHVLPIFRKIITVVIYIIATLFVFSAWGINIAPLLAGAGIAGLALAFAMQESLRNIFGGISLAFDRAYGIGDRLKLNDGTIGTVIDISLRSTKIRTPTGDLITVPNGKIANENFQNYAQPTQETVVVIPFSVTYGTDVEHVKKVAMSVIKELPDVINRPKDEKIPICDFLEMGQYSLNFRIAYWIPDYKKSWDSKLAATDKLYAALMKNKIEVPFPTTSVVLKK